MPDAEVRDEAVGDTALLDSSARCSLDGSDDSEGGEDDHAELHVDVVCVVEEGNETGYRDGYRKGVH